MNISTANAYPDSPQTSTTLYMIITIFISNASQNMPSKRAASRDFYTLYSMFSSDEKWVLMHTAAAGGEKRAWLPIKAVCGYETIAFGSWKNWTYYYIHHLL